MPAPLNPIMTTQQDIAEATVVLGRSINAAVLDLAPALVALLDTLEPLGAVVGAVDAVVDRLLAHSI